MIQYGKKNEILGSVDIYPCVKIDGEIFPATEENAKKYLKENLKLSLQDVADSQYKKNSSLDLTKYKEELQNTPLTEEYLDSLSMEHRSKLIVKMTNYFNTDKASLMSDAYLRKLVCFIAESMDIPILFEQNSLEKGYEDDLLQQIAIQAGVSCDNISDMTLTEKNRLLIEISNKIKGSE